MPGTMQQNHGYLEGVGRIRLHYRTWEIPEPEAAILVVHGMFEHGGRYAGVGESMAASGFSTFAVDLRGHGSSEGRRGHIARFDVLLQDLDRFRREVQGLVPVGVPFFLLGHSMGGLVGLRYLEEYDVPFAGAVFTSPWLGTAYDAPRWKVMMGTVFNHVLPAFPFTVQIDPADLTHDEERAADYADDPQIHSTITPRMFSELSGAIETAFRRGDRITVPILFLLGGDDTLVSTERSLAFARMLPAQRVDVEILENMRHEVLQERGRAAIISEIRDWITAHLP
ncbi:MAG TPA: lysophospholipase [Longimicrobiales bacterium]|nr:lysophospholipase [Longimicrobiales bacterium]